jgi:S1-C subfamily serine protease
MPATAHEPPTPLMPPLPPVPAGPLTVMTRDGMRIELGGLESGTIAGAQLQRVGDLKDYFGVEDGLLVLRVIPGTVAERSGLRGGDVILRADDAPITTPLTLRRAMDRSSDQAVKLEVVRKRKKENIVLQWDR